MSKALYRQYRPLSLDQVIGQTSIVQSLKTALKTGDFHHSYIFTGPRGTGKTSIARIFAHEINHFPYTLEDSYLDIIEIDAASFTGVDHIRELREKAIIAPTEGQYKIYILDEVHMLSKNAFNALLKIIEEPPAHVIFIFATTELEKVPITITSRSQIYNFALASTDIMVEHLNQIAKKEHINLTPEALKILVQRGGGSFRDTLSLLDQARLLSEQEITAELLEKCFGLPSEQLISELLAAYQTKDFTKITTSLKTALNSGLQPTTIATDLIAKICHQPKPDFLPLLGTLSSVIEPFAEAKLLLALAGPLATPHQAQNPTTPNLTQVPTNPHLTQTTPKTNPYRTKTIITHENPLRPAKKSPLEPLSGSGSPLKSAISKNQTDSPAPSKENFDWNNYLTKIKTQSLSVHSQLTKVDHKLDHQTLNIFTKAKIAYKILSSDHNHRLLVNSASGLEILIHPPDSTPPPVELKQISDIMGELQEVNLDESSPF